MCSYYHDSRLGKVMVTNPIGKVEAVYATLVAFLAASYANGQAFLEAKSEAHPVAGKVAQSDTVIAGTVVVIVGSVGIVIVSSVSGAFDPPANTGLSESQQNLLAGYGAMLDLVEPLLVVLMAVILILAVMRIRA